MEGLELIAFEIISNVGMAKSLAIEALRVVRSGYYAEGEERLSEALNILQKDIMHILHYTKGSSRRKDRIFINAYACRRSNDECRSY